MKTHTQTSRKVAALTATVRPRRYTVYLDRNGEGRWNRKVNGRIVAECGEGYTGNSRRAAMNAAARAAKKDAGAMPHNIYFDEP